MTSYQAQVSVAAKGPRVWSVLADVVRWPAWLSTVSRVSPLDDPSPGLGARYRVEQPRLRPAVWTMTVWEPPRRFTWVTRSWGLEVIGDHQVIAEGEAASRVTLEIAFRGPLRPVAVWVGGRLTREYLEREAASLKEVVEALSER